jgi:hypothetical protein
LYASFWDPRFLFVDGPGRFRSTHLMPFFLLPMAGLLTIGIVGALQRRSAVDGLLVFGLLSAPLLASAGGEAQAIWRLLHLAPFGVLLATSGLQMLIGGDHSQTKEEALSTHAVYEPAGSENRRSTSSRRLIELTMIAVVYGLAIGLGIWYHDALPHAQALVRAASLPIVVMGLVVLLRQSQGAFGSVSQIAIGGAGVIIAVHFADFIAGPAATTLAALLVAIAVAPFWRQMPDSIRRHPFLPQAAVAFGVTQFLYTYLDYGQVHRVGRLPASAIALAARLAVASAAFTAVVAVIRMTSRDSVSSLRDRRTAIFGAVVCAQIAYFFLDYFLDVRLRAVHATVVLVMAAALAMSVRTGNHRRGGYISIAIAGLAGIIAIQFSFVAWDYFTESQVRGSADEEGNARIPFEAVIDRTRTRPVSAIYLGQIGSYGAGDLYWRFYLLKHHREDLLQRTISDRTFRPDRIPSLPPGTIVITSQSRESDSAIDASTAEGLIADRQLVRAPNGASIFWILETAGH